MSKGKSMDILIKRLRYRILDADPLLNVLTENLEFSDDQLEAFIIEALYDINESPPRRRNFKIHNFPVTGLLLDGAMVFLLKARGLLHLRNQISYSDAGTSVNLDDKSGHYAQWANQMESQYRLDVQEFKRGLVPRMFGVGSPMRYY